MKLSAAKLKSLLFLSYCFLMATYFMPLKANSIALIICAAISLLFIKKLPLDKLVKFPLNIFLLLFVYLLIGMFYTQNEAVGWAIIERNYSLLFVPFIVSSFSILSLKQQKWILNSFVFFTTAVAVYLLCYAIVDYFQTGSVYIEGKSGHPLYNKFMHHRLTEPLEIHAIYFALYLSFSFVYLLNHFISTIKRLPIVYKVSYIVLFLFYSLMIVLLKSALFALAVPIAISILLLIHFGKKIFKKTSYLIASTVLIVALAAFSFYGVQSKIQNFSTDLKLTEEHPGPLKIRLGVWYCSWETIKDNFFLGVGTGDGDDALLETYNEYDFFIGKRDQFNAHNMFLQYWISNGILAVIIYLTLLLALSWHFYKCKNYPGFLLVFLFFAFSFTESTMMRQGGIVFFVFFSSLLYFRKNTSDHLITS